MRKHKYINQIKNKIEGKRNSKNLFWRLLVFVKDFFWFCFLFFGRLVWGFYFLDEKKYQKHVFERFGVFSYYFAHSSDECVRKSASSGGFCKAMTLFLVEKKIVDEAIITRNIRGSFVAETIATNKKKDIISPFTNSIYSPTNPFSVLERLDKNKTYVFVGLPCHCKKIRQLQERGQYKNIKLLIGLFCSHSPRIEFTHELLENIGVKKGDVDYIRYREGVWPGSFVAHLKNGEKKQFSYQEAWPFSKKYFSTYCEHCNLLPVYSDFSAGDPWGFNLKKKNLFGETMVLCLNKRAEDLIKQAEKNKYIDLSLIDKKKLLRRLAHHVKIKFDKKIKGAI